MEFKPTREQLNQAWDDREAGRPLSADMRLYLEKLDKAMLSGAVEVTVDRQLEEAKDLARQYEELLAKLATYPDEVITKLHQYYPQVNKAIRGKQTRDYNAMQEEQRKRTFMERYPNGTGKLAVFSKEILTQLIEESKR